MSVLIFANGEIGDVSWITPYLEPPSIIIAADGGLSHIHSLGRLPDILIGDLDSSPESLKTEIRSAGVQVQTYPEDKDESDLELALSYAVAHYDDEILVFGSLGGRLDQSISNVMLLANPILAGRKIELLEPFQRAWLVDNFTNIEGEVGDRVSIIPMAQDVTIKRTTGLKWELKDELLVFGQARGISNVMTSTNAYIEVHKGSVLCIHIDSRWNR